MNNNSIFTKSFALLMFLGSLAAASNAGALTNHSGTICKNFKADEVGFVDYLPNGTRSLKTSAQQIICPLTRNEHNLDGSLVYVDITHGSTAKTTCTAYSYEFTGKLMASTSLTWTGKGFHEFELNLTGAGKSGFFSDYSVLCTIPGKGVGVILDIDLDEL